MPTKTLTDLSKGRNICGNQFLGSKNFSEIDPPEWFERERFENGRKFLRDFLGSILFSYFCALLVGFTVQDLSDALVFTGRSLGPDNSRRRYLETLAHLIKWHTEGSDIFDRNSDACKSLLLVQNMHDQVRKILLDCSKERRLTFVSQYDTALVQSGFIGPIIMYPDALGIRTSTETLEDYIHFWRVIGYALGLQDRFNMCGGSYADVFNICKEVEQEIILPGLETKSATYERLSTEFIEGMQAICPFITRNVVFAFICPKMGIVAPSLNLWEWCCLCMFWFHFWLIGLCPPYRKFCNGRLEKLLLTFKHKQLKL